MEESKIRLKVRSIYAVYKQFLWIGIFIVAMALYFISPLKYIEYKYISACMALFVFLRAIYGYLYHYFLVYDLYEDRMVFKQGVFSVKTDFLELYRVKDYKVYQSFFMRIFKIQTIILITSDRSNKIIEIKGIKNSNVVNIIRLQVEKQRRIKGVREFD